MSEASLELTEIEREALSLAERVTARSASASDFSQVRAWRTQSSTHEAAFIAAMTMKSAMIAEGEALRQKFGLDLIAARAKRDLKQSGQLTRRALIGGAMAASFGGVALLARPPLDLWPSIDELNAKFRSDRKATKAFAFGSADVELNRATSATLRNGQLELIEGEMLVDGTKMSSLSIRAGRDQIMAQNAQLNLLHTEAESCVTCLSGRVIVQHASTGRSVALLDGQQLEFNGQSLEPTRSADMAVTLAWRSGRIVFLDTPLSKVVADLNRYKSGHIVLTNPALAERKVNGVFEIGATRAILADIQTLTGAKHTELPGGLFLLS